MIHSIGKILSNGNNNFSNNKNKVCNNNINNDDINTIQYRLQKFQQLFYNDDCDNNYTISNGRNDECDNKITPTTVILLFKDFNNNNDDWENKTTAATAITVGLIISTAVLVNAIT